MHFITLKNERNIEVDINVDLIKYYECPSARPNQVLINMGNDRIIVNESMESVRAAIAFKVK